MARITRGCGHRTVGGIYLCGSGLAVTCLKLPVEIPDACPCCGEGVKQTRGMAFVQTRLFKLTSELCGADHCARCPLGGSLAKEVGMMWVGEKHYTPASFTEESRNFGVSKRIAQVPKRFKVGETWILLAHPQGYPKMVHPEDCTCDPPLMVEHEEPKPGIFHAFRPERIEMPLKYHDYIATNGKIIENRQDEIRGYLKRGITPVFVEIDEKGKAVEDTDQDIITAALTDDEEDPFIIRMPRILPKQETIA